MTDAKDAGNRSQPPAEATKETPFERFEALV